MNAKNMVKAEIATGMRAKGIQVHAIKDLTEHLLLMGAQETSVIYWAQEGGPLRTHLLPGTIMDNLED